MKKIALLSALLFLSTSLLFAQLAPQTVVSAKLIVKKEHVVPGPYARFAQQYLGVIAPLNEKTTYSLAGGELNAYELGTTSNQGATTIEESNTKLFKDLGITPIVSTNPYGVNRMAAKEKSLQEMAYDASSTIFSLRKRRFDLVSGEIGPEAFNAGLSAAIGELSRLENEYVELFLGKKEISYKVYEFSIVPVATKTAYSICRFSEDQGILDVVEQSGEPIILSLVDQNVVKAPAPTTAIKGVVYVSKQYMDFCSATLLIGAKPIVTNGLGIYQFGVSARVPR